MQRRSHDRTRAIETAILAGCHVTPERAAEVVQAVHATDPTVDLTAFEIALLWERMSRPYIGGWLSPCQGIKLFFTRYADVLGRSADKAA